jgi:hypothetical protein
VHINLPAEIMEYIDMMILACNCEIKITLFFVLVKFRLNATNLVIQLWEKSAPFLWYLFRTVFSVENCIECCGQ